jgi:hypothetical protein
VLRDIQVGVPKFLLGFISASLLWTAAAYAVINGYVDLNLDPIKIKSDTDKAAESSDGKKSSLRGRRSNKRRLSSTRSNRRSYRSVLTGDALGEDEIRGVDMVGNSGEQQLTDNEIEQGIDGVFNQIKRCLFLAADDEPVKGRVVLGMRIEGTGRVTRLNLRGPIPVVRGEAGSCLRKTVKEIQYRSFNGPAMVVHYPITLD